MKHIQSLHLWINALQAWHYPLVIVHTEEKTAHRLQTLLYEGNKFHSIWTKDGMLLCCRGRWYHIVFIIDDRKSTRNQLLGKRANYSMEIEKVHREIKVTLSSPYMKTIYFVVSMKEIDNALITIFNKIKLKKIKRNDIIYKMMQ